MNLNQIFFSSVAPFAGNRPSASYQLSLIGRIMGSQIPRLSLKPKFVLLIVSLFAFLFAVESAYAQSANSGCGPLGNAFGPFDYRVERGNALFLVESTHFLPYIEAVVRGHTSTTPGPDIDYTLRAFPNHHRALISMVRLGEKEKTTKPIGSRYSIDCWFERALRFRPDDTTVRMIFASYLSDTHRASAAEDQLEQAAILAKENPFTQYNIGLVYFDMKLYDKALFQAHRALALGFERTQLRDMLEKAGKWQPPAVEPPGASISAPK